MGVCWRSSKRGYPKIGSLHFKIMSNNNSKKIVRNSIILYIRLFFVLIANLYISRVVLHSLGIYDFGIYNAVGGFVSLFTVLSSSMSAACSRFLTIELGKGDFKNLKRTFSTSIVIHICLSIIIVLILEPVGFSFINNHMNLTDERLNAANIVFQCSLFTFIMNVISVPYNASIISHENMDAYAMISIIETSLKIIIAYIIGIMNVDRLILYAILLAATSLFIRCLYGLYCVSKYSECKFRWQIDKEIVKEMTKFASWNFIGSLSGVSKDQGINVLLNIFFGVLVNSAYGLASQVKYAVTNFSNGLLSALNPQIIKSYSQKNYEYMMDLIYKGCKFSYFLMLIISIPLLLNTNYILSLWLGKVPEHTVSFVQLFIIYILIESYSGPLITGMLATGKIRNYQLIVGGLQCLTLPISWLFLKIGYNAESTFIISIIISIIVLSSRLIMLKKLIPISITQFINKVIIPTIAISTLTGGISIFLSKAPLCTGDFDKLIITTLVSILTSCLFIFLIGTTQSEKKFIINRINLK